LTNNFISHVTTELSAHRIRNFCCLYWRCDSKQLYFQQFCLDIYLSMFGRKI